MNKPVIQKKNKLTRREMLKKSVAASAAIIAASMFNLGRYRIFAASSSEYSAVILRGC